MSQEQLNKIINEMLQEIDEKRDLRVFAIGS